MHRFTILCAAGAIACSTFALFHQTALAADKDQGNASKDVRNDARQVVANALDHAVAGDLDSLLKEDVGSHDRDRIGKGMKKVDETKYKEYTDKFKDNWKKKYGRDFDAAGHSSAANAFDVDKGKDDSRADVKISGSGVKEPVYLHVHKEKNGKWVIALPDTLSGDTFADKMLDAAKGLADDNDWPNSVDEAYRHAASHMLRPLQYKK
ncbi:MAG TPA: hypothetical protein VL282_11830 [Tepidisphaeraceae bacterium]|jgi:hypothetical protein|nr:hypothetical protein [Tepidisphaeraceae bacterium]